MSKESIRNQIEKLQAESKNILNSNSVSSEIRLFINSMMTILEVIVAVLLEKKTRKNSSNSGLPPSRNEGPNGNRNKNTADRKSIGSQIGHTKNTETHEVVTPKECSKCQCDLRNTKAQDKESRQKTDIVYEIITHIVTAEIVECPDCGHINKGQFPKGMDGKVQYGNGIKATILNFLMVQMMSFERVQEHINGIIGRFISQAVMLKYVAQLSDGLKEWEEKQIAKLLASPVIHCDETSLRVNKLNHWIHSYSYEDTTLLFVHPKRGTEAINDINIIPQYGGTLVHDCWASYLSYNNTGHALCGGHLLRELKFVEDSVKHPWASKMKKLLQDACHLVNKRSQTKKLTSKEYKKLQSKYRKILAMGKKEMPPFPVKNGKRGRTKCTDAQNLWLRLSQYEDSVLLFARVKEVDFTNNRAERDLRSSKLKQKVAGCFRTLEYAKHFCRISSYVKSMRYKGYSSFEAISLAVQGNIPD
jgi:hypothetical protein